ncbi:MAG: TIGR02300 family protein [Pseudomonadota bacterium]|nr:TIGR02300 family protein [Pseudomonadota bacterium]
MVKPEWGCKRICPHCGVKYYDFHKNPITCPSCSKPFDLEVAQKVHGGKSTAKSAVKPEIKGKTETDIDIDDDDQDDSLIEDADELGDDDVSDVVNVKSDDDD